MGKVVSNMSMSLDGFVSGPRPSSEHPLGEGGDRLHRWLGLGSTPADPRDAEVLAEMTGSVGAVVMGRRSFEVAEGLWGEDPPFRVPVFVLTHAGRAPLTRGAATFTFVTDGFPLTVSRARRAAGDKDVSLHGASATQQAIAAGLLEELQVTVVPVLLARGRRLFEHLGDRPVALERTRVLEHRDVTHLRFRVLPGEAG